jgi:hypothetical protein
VGLLLIKAGVAESFDPQARRQKLDLAGIVTLTVGVFGLAFVITQGEALGWRSPTALGLMAATVLSLAAFVVIERRHPHPMFDFAVFRIRDFSGAIVGCIGMNCSYWPFMIYLPLYFTAGLGLGTTAAGWALLAYTVPFLVMPPIAQWLLLRYQARLVIPAGLFVIGLGFVLMKLGSGLTHLGIGAVLPGALVAGIGLGLTTTPASNMTTGAVPAHRAGMASGMDVSARLIALALNIALMGLVLVAGLTASLRAALGPAMDTMQLRALAEQLAGGDVAGAQRLLATVAAPDAAGAILQAAAAEGFGGVMLYGAAAAWLAAALSLAVFGRRDTAAQGGARLAAGER